MNMRFPVLSIISILIRIFGWLILLAGLAYAIAQGIIEPNLEGHTFRQEDQIQLGGGIFASLFGLFFVAIGEVVGVLFSIEANTRKAAEK